MSAASVGAGSDLIRYEDATHVVTYEAGASARGVEPAATERRGAASRAPGARSQAAGAGASPARGAAGGRSGAGLREGTAGELQAWRIETVLSADAGKADRPKPTTTSSCRWK